MAQTPQDGYKLYNERKFKEAYEALYEAAAYENNSEAQYFIGMMNFDGDGVEKSLEDAMKWWKKASRNGHLDSANRLSAISTGTSVMF